MVIILGAARTACAVYISDPLIGSQFASQPLKGAAWASSSTGPYHVSSMGGFSETGEILEWKAWYRYGLTLSGDGDASITSDWTLQIEAQAKDGGWAFSRAGIKIYEPRPDWGEDHYGYIDQHEIYDFGYSSLMTKTENGSWTHTLQPDILYIIEVYAWIQISPGSDSIAMAYADPVHYFTDPSHSNTHSIDLTYTEGDTRQAGKEVAAGDINDDGSVDLVDAMLALKGVACLPPGQMVYIEADVDGDGAIGMAEAVHALQKAAETR